MCGLEYTVVATENSLTFIFSVPPPAITSTLAFIFIHNILKHLVVTFVAVAAVVRDRVELFLVLIPVPS